MKNKKFKFTLLQQLLFIFVLLTSIILISLLLVLPKFLLPIYENNIYNELKQPLGYIENNKETYYLNNISYIYIDEFNKEYKISDNFSIITNLKTDKEINDFLSNINKKYGKIKRNKTTYYYYTSDTLKYKIITITNDTYINKIKKDISFTILSIMGITFSIITFIIILWYNFIVNRIINIKEKVNNITNTNYKNKKHSFIIDELHNLDITIDNMKKHLIEEEEYKNQMYQNISHDFKTPITVMKSYIEASEDGIETKDNTLKIIKEQLNKLEKKVHSLLYLNKLNYIKTKKDNLNEQCDVSLTVQTAVDKFKLSNKDIEFVIDINKKETIFNGSEEMWEAIIDNILSNFVRYAKKKIKITIKNKKIILYNDGPNIDENIINNIFTPYEKGINGVFGFGLSIVKNTLQILEYDIHIENKKKEGVYFIIK